MKVRDIVTFSKIDEELFIGRFVIVGTYSWKKRYDSKKDPETTLDKYLNCDAVSIEASDTFTEMDNPAIVIYIHDYYITKEERKHKEKE